jgi:hypothetical protein
VNDGDPNRRENRAPSDNFRLSAPRITYPYPDSAFDIGLEIQTAAAEMGSALI